MLGQRWRGMAAATDPLETNPTPPHPPQTALALGRPIELERIRRPNSNPTPPHPAGRDLAAATAAAGAATAAAAAGAALTVESAGRGAATAERLSVARAGLTRWRGVASDHKNGEWRGDMPSGGGEVSVQRCDFFSLLNWRVRLSCVGLIFFITMTCITRISQNNLFSHDHVMILKVFTKLFVKN